MRALGYLGASLLVAACTPFETSREAPPSATDGGATSSTSRDSGIAGSWCDGGTYCDDFERDAPEPVSPLAKLDVASDVASIITDRPFEGTRSVRFAVSSSQETRHAHFLIEQAMPAKSASLEFAFRPNSAFGLGSNHMDIGDIGFSGPNGTVTIAIVAFEDHMLFYLGDGAHGTGEVGKQMLVKMGAWTHFVLTVSLETPLVELAVDGETIAHESFQLAARMDKVTVALGPDYMQEHTNQFNLDFDAFRIDLQ